MKTDQIVMLFVALLLGMLLANMLKSVCGCKVVEGGNNGNNGPGIGGPTGSTPNSNNTGGTGRTGRGYNTDTQTRQNRGSSAVAYGTADCDIDLSTGDCTIGEYLGEAGQGWAANR